jgi:hypothetical protein
MNSPEDDDSAKFPFAADGGVPYVRTEGTDPIRSWIALMELVQALRPQWHERPPVIGHDYRM